MRCSCEPGVGWIGPCCGERPPVPTCFHCEIDLSPSEAFDVCGEIVCSTRCAAAIASFGHSEACEAPECADGAILTLPSMLCSFCGAPTGGPTAHALCRDKVRHALEGEAAEDFMFAAFGRGAHA